MMGEYIFYCRGRIVGGINDSRFLVKPAKSAAAMMQDTDMEFPFLFPYLLIIPERLHHTSAKPGCGEAAFSEKFGQDLPFRYALPFFIASIASYDSRTHTCQPETRCPAVTFIPRPLFFCVAAGKGIR